MSQSNHSVTCTRCDGAGGHYATVAVTSGTFSTVTNPVSWSPCPYCHGKGGWAGDAEVAGPSPDDFPIPTREESYEYSKSIFGSSPNCLGCSGLTTNAFVIDGKQPYCSQCYDKFQKGIFSPKQYIIPSPEKPTRAPCPECSGNGNINGWVGMSQINPNHRCKTCQGVGEITKMEPAEETPVDQYAHINNGEPDVKVMQNEVLEIQSKLSNLIYMIKNSVLSDDERRVALLTAANFLLTAVDETFDAEQDVWSVNNSVHDGASLAFRQIRKK